MRFVSPSGGGPQASGNIIAKLCGSPTLATTQRYGQYGIFCAVVSSERMRLISSDIRVLGSVDDYRSLVVAGQRRASALGYFCPPPPPVRVPCR